ncbi:restriction endonuclease subunit S [Paenibacillus azoreducens]|uniref:restriction endonuclease subunit S n=1 Tax=Paenibacillus azoreducens TaxID=116718 RepID=UPI0039F62424
MSKTKVKTTEELLKEGLIPEEEQPYKVPENWVWVKLGKVVDINPPKPKLNYPDSHKTSFLSMSAVNPVAGKITSVEEREYHKVKTGYTYFQENDILFAKITPCMENGNTVIVKGMLNGFGFGSTEFFVLRSSNVVEKRFIYYLLRSAKFRNEAKAVMSGAVGQQRVPKDFLVNYRLCLPPVYEQQRIVYKIESLFAKIDEAKRFIDEAKESFELRRAAILDKAFRGELTKEWRAGNQNTQDVGLFINDLRQKQVKTEIFADLKGWKLVQLKDLFSIYGGGTPSKSKEDYWKGSIPWLSPKDMKTNYLEDTMDHISNEAVDNSAVKLLNGGAVSIVVRSGILKHSLPAAILDVPYTINQDMKAFDSGDYNINEYLLWYIIGNERELLTRYSKSGTTVGSIVFEKFKNHYLPLPPYEELKQILFLIKKFITKERKTTQLIDELQVKVLKQSILEKAFRGELGANDPTEESAIELLKETLNSQK